MIFLHFSSMVPNPREHLISLFRLFDPLLLGYIPLPLIRVINLALIYPLSDAQINVGCIVVESNTVSLYSLWSGIMTRRNRVIFIMKII